MDKLWIRSIKMESRNNLFFSLYPQLLSSNKKIPATYFVTAKTRSEDIGRKTCNCGDAHGVLSCYHPYASYNCHVEDCEPGRGCGMFWAEKCWGVCYA
ncbi:MAG: bacteriocin fulvocin C-related protein [Alistipes finegoldii]